MQTISIIREIVQILFYIAAPTIAFYGLYSWRRELLGKSKYELSKNILKSLYKVRDEIIKCQSDSYLFANRYSYSERRRGESETRNETAILNSMYFYQKRFERIKSEVDKMIEYQIEAEASWGQAVSNVINEIFKVVNEFGLAIHFYHGIKLELEQINRLPDEEEKEYLTNSHNILQGKHPKYIKPYTLIYSSNMKQPEEEVLDDDGFQEQFDKAVSDIEKCFKPYLKQLLKN